MDNKSDCEAVEKTIPLTKENVPDARIFLLMFRVREPVPPAATFIISSRSA